MIDPVSVGFEREKEGNRTYWTWGLPGIPGVLVRDRHAFVFRVGHTTFRVRDLPALGNLLSMLPPHMDTHKYAAKLRGELPTVGRPCDCVVCRDN